MIEIEQISKEEIYETLTNPNRQDIRQAIFDFYVLLMIHIAQHYHLDLAKLRINFEGSEFAEYGSNDSEIVSQKMLGAYFFKPLKLAAPSLSRFINRCFFVSHTTIRFMQIPFWKMFPFVCLIELTDDMIVNHLWKMVCFTASYYWECQPDNHDQISDGLDSFESCLFAMKAEGEKPTWLQEYRDCAALCYYYTVQEHSWLSFDETKIHFPISPDFQKQDMMEPKITKSVLKGSMQTVIREAMNESLARVVVPRRLIQWWGRQFFSIKSIDGTYFQWPDTNTMTKYYMRYIQFLLGKIQFSDNEKECISKIKQLEDLAQVELEHRMLNISRPDTGNTSFEPQTQYYKYDYTADFPDNFNVLKDSLYKSISSCPICNSQLAPSKFNVPFYYSTEQFKSLYITNTMTCIECGMNYISTKEILRLLHRANKSRRSREILTMRAHNTVIKSKRDNSFYFYPVINGGVARKRLPNNHPFLEQQRKTIPPGSQPLTYQSQLAEESFLFQMGYTTKIDIQERHAVLHKAIDQFGKRRVIDHLRFLIDMRRNSQKDYMQAISIWSEDIEYIIHQL